MNVLAIDTCLGACSVAVGLCGRDGPAAHERALMQTGHAEALIPMIARVMAAAGLPFAGLERIVVTHGPGTFTGTRIGVATARALALATGAGIVGVSSLWPIGAQAARRHAGRLPADGAVAVAGDARRSELYVQIIDRDGRELTGPLLVSPGHAATLVPGCRLLAVGSGRHLLAEAAGAAGRTVVVEHGDALCPERHEPDAVMLIERGRTDPPLRSPLKPLYLRPPDAKPQPETSP